MEKWKKGLQSEDILKKYNSGEFIKIIENAEIIKKFDIDIYFKIIEKLAIFKGNKIFVMLLDGSEVEVIIQ